MTNGLKLISHNDHILSRLIKTNYFILFIFNLLNKWISKNKKCSIFVKKEIIFFGKNKCISLFCKNSK